MCLTIKKYLFREVKMDLQTEQLTVEISKHELDVLKRFAESHQLRLNTFIIYALERYMENRVILDEYRKCKACNDYFMPRSEKQKFCCQQCCKNYSLASKKASNFKERAREDGYLTPADILEVRKGKTCFYCGCELNESNLTIDHFIPLSKGGQNIRENLVACCFGCNNKKGVKLYEQFSGLATEKELLSIQ